MRPLRSRPAILLLSVVLASCGTTTVTQVTPWFEIRYFKPAEPMPHVIALGTPSSKAFTKLETGWLQVDGGEGRPGAVYRLQDAVLMVVVRDEVEYGKVTLLEARTWREGASAPIRANLTSCRQVEVLARSSTLLCVACGEQALYAVARCEEASFRELDLEGRVLREFSAPISLDPARKCSIQRLSGLDAERWPVFEVACLPPPGERKGDRLWDHSQVVVAPGRAPREGVAVDPAGGLPWEDPQVRAATTRARGAP